MQRASRIATCALTVALVTGSGGCGWGDDDGSTGPATSATRAPTTTSASVPGSAATSTPPTTRPDAAAPSARLVWEHDFPDPFVLATEGHYFAYATEGGLLRIQRLDGDTLEALDGLTEALAPTPQWAAPFSTWAPAVMRTSRGFVMYYSALVAGTDRHCIGAAFAVSPTGPFVDDSSEPFLCPRDLGGAIDPSPYVDLDGRAYLLWKNDGVTLRSESALWSLPLLAEGTSAGEPSARLVATDQAWEYPHVEAPSMARVGDTYWLAYSGNWWNQSGYGIGLARCAAPSGPCEKPYEQPIISSSAGAEGPGGLEFFSTVDGALYAAFHAWQSTPGYPGSRALWIGPVDVDHDVPILPAPPPTRR